MKNIVVTGGLVFIGSNLIELLLKKKYKVINVDKVTYSSSFYNTSSFVSALENRQGLKIACLEEIALNYNWINKQDIIQAIKFYGKCVYSNYLKKIIE